MILDLCGNALQRPYLKIDGTDLSHTIIVKHTLLKCFLDQVTVGVKRSILPAKLQATLLRLPLL